MCKCHLGETQISNYVSVWSAGLCDLRVYTLFIIDGLPKKGGNAFWIQVLLLLIIISYMQHYISFILHFSTFVFVFVSFLLCYVMCPALYFIHINLFFICRCAYIFVFILHFDSWNGKAKIKFAHVFQERNRGRSFYKTCGWRNEQRNARSFYARYGLTTWYQILAISYPSISLPVLYALQRWLSYFSSFRSLEFMEICFFSPFNY